MLEVAGPLQRHVAFALLFLADGIDSLQNRVGLTRCIRTLHGYLHRLHLLCRCGKRYAAEQQDRQNNRKQPFKPACLFHRESPLSRI